MPLVTCAFEGASSDFCSPFIHFYFICYYFFNIYILFYSIFTSDSVKRFRQKHFQGCCLILEQSVSPGRLLSRVLSYDVNSSHLCLSDVMY